MLSNNFWHSHKHSWINGTVEKVHNQADMTLQGGLLVRNYLFKFYAVVLCNAYMVLFIPCSHCLMPSILSLCREETKLGSHMNMQASIFFFYCTFPKQVCFQDNQPMHHTLSVTRKQRQGVICLQNTLTRTEQHFTLSPVALWTSPVGQCTCRTQL